MAQTLPQRTLPIAEGNAFTLYWYRFFQDLSTSAGSGVTLAQVEALIAAVVAALEAEIAAVQAIAEDALAQAGGLNVLSLLALSELDGYGG
jgi:hypothetical protein